VPTIDTPLLPNGSTKITATLGNRASGKITGGTVIWTRDQNGAWTCATDGAKVTDKFSPASCPATAAGP